MARTLLENANYINTTIKPAIKSAIEAKGVTVSDSDSFLDYATRIGQIEGSVNTSKLSYSVGTNDNPKLTEGRYVSGFAAMTSGSLVPRDSNGAWLDVDFSKSFEIGARFKLSSLSSGTLPAVFGSGIANNLFAAPIILWNVSNQKLALDISVTGSAFAVDVLLDYAISANTWYFVKMIFNSSNNSLKVQITTDFETYTTLYDSTLSGAVYYYGSAAMVFGCVGRQPNNFSSNDMHIDMFNTYIKDDSGSIVWGAYGGA